MIVPVPLLFSNAFLVKGERPVLVDTGSPGEAARIEKALLKENVPLSHLSLLLHTHGHSDHCGSTHALKQKTAAPAAIHPADAPMLQSGRNGSTKATSLTGLLLRPLIDRRFEPVEPDVLLQPDTTDLSAYGLDARLLHTPGHTAGSVSLLFRNGEAIVGDLLMGGYFGGFVAPHYPGYPYFADSLEKIHASLKLLLELGATRFYTGHGGPLTATAIRKHFAGKLS